MRRAMTSNAVTDDNDRAESDTTLETVEQLTETRSVVTLRRTLQDQKGQVTDTGQVDSGKRRRAVAISHYDDRKRKHVHRKQEVVTS